MAKLIILSGPSKGLEYSLKEETVIGRQSSNTIPLEDTKSSRQNSLVFEEGDEYYITDLGSRNGTILNGKLVKQKERLRSGDQIQVGDTILLFNKEGTPESESSKRNIQPGVEGRATQRCPAVEEESEPVWKPKVKEKQPFSTEIVKPKESVDISKSQEPVDISKLQEPVDISKLQEFVDISKSQEPVDISKSQEPVDISKSQEPVSSLKSRPSEETDYEATPIAKEARGFAGYSAKKTTAKEESNIMPLKEIFLPEEKKQTSSQETLSEQTSSEQKKQTSSKETEQTVRREKASNVPGQTVRREKSPIDVIEIQRTGKGKILKTYRKSSDNFVLNFLSGDFGEFGTIYKLILALSMLLFMVSLVWVTRWLTLQILS